MAETTEDLKRAQAKAAQNRPRGGPVRAVGGVVDKPKHFGKSMKKLATYLRDYKWQLVATVVFAIASTTFAIMSPKLLGNMTNKIVDDFIAIKTYDTVMQELGPGAKLPSGTTITKFAEMMKQQAAVDLQIQKDSIAALPPEEQKPILDKLNSELAAQQEKAAQFAEQLKNIPLDQQAQIENLDLSKRPTMDFGALGKTAVLLIALYVASAGFGFAQGWIITGVTQRVTYRFRRDISEKINRLPLRYFDRRSFGDVLSRVTNDIDTISQSLSQALSQIITSLAMIIGILIMMLSINWQMTGVAVFVVIVSFVMVGVIVGRSQKYFKKQQDSLGAIQGHVEETFAGHNVVKAFGGEKRVIKKFSRINRDLHDSAWKSQFLSGLMWPITNFVGNLGYVAVAVLGGWKAINGQISIGEIQAFIQYMQQFNQPIMQVSQIANIVQSTAAASERVFEFLEEEEEK